MLARNRLERAECRFFRSPEGVCDRMMGLWRKSMSLRLSRVNKPRYGEVALEAGSRGAASFSGDGPAKLAMSPVLAAEAISRQGWSVTSRGRRNWRDSREIQVEGEEGRPLATYADLKVDKQPKCFALSDYSLSPL